MRRLEHCIYGASPSFLAFAKRHARRRQLLSEPTKGSKADDCAQVDWKSMNQESSQPNPDVSSLRSSGMVGAPATTSLDKIRSELTAMRNENRLKMEMEKQAAEQQQWEKLLKEREEQDSLGIGIDLANGGKQNDSLTQHIQIEYSRLNKPNDAFRIGKEVVDGVAQRSFLLQEKRFKDADDVLRKNKNVADTRRYMALAFSSSPEQRTRLLDVLKRMQAQWAVEMDKLTKASDSPQGISKENINDTAADDLGAASRLAWLTVLEELSDEDIRALWKTDILDAETLSSLLSESLGEPSAAENSCGSGSAGSNGTRLTPEMNSSPDLLLDEKIKYVQQLHHLEEITNTIRETELSDVPSIDLAPTIVKARGRQFESVTEEELRQLEEYEESGAMHLSLKKQSPSTGAVKAEACNVDISTAMLDRVLFPSNRFLNAVAQKDASLRRSLERMERIKRETLLDPEFQEAVRFAHAVEEASVAPHLGGWASRDDEGGRTHGERDGSLSRSSRRALSKRDKREARSLPLRGPMARSPYSPEVIPYFYNDIHSIVPPSGAFNLPDPALTKTERAALRGRRRRMRKGARYSQ
ncbi:hypothetical protein JKF63_01083 [Porcisia hertigi]|uniref:Uncharacterized protein n=1 Tax=Porcisia hertigi TaxID=2761500 RepID=A0A836ICA0_9TRYP|nr:hypothetical protein JKF63_01083 [Porcisia hertigi]